MIPVKTTRDKLRPMARTPIKAPKAPKRKPNAKRDYEKLKADFVQGYFELKWKSVSQFAEFHGVDPTNGSWKKNTTGWLDEAIDEKGIFDSKLGSLIADKLVKSVGDNWVKVYESLNKTALMLSEKLEKAVKETDFLIEEDKGDGENAKTVKSIDAKNLKDCASAGNDIMTLLKKTTINNEIPLSIESSQKIKIEVSKAKEIQKIDKVNLPIDPLEGITEEELNDEIAKLEGDETPISSDGVLVESSKILKAVCGGRITPAQGKQLSDILESHRKSIELVNLEDRIKELENSNNDN